MEFPHGQSIQPIKSMVPILLPVMCVAYLLKQGNGHDPNLRMGSWARNFQEHS